MPAGFGKFKILRQDLETFKILPARFGKFNILSARFGKFNILPARFGKFNILSARFGKFKILPARLENSISCWQDLENSRSCNSPLATSLGNSRRITHQLAGPFLAGVTFFSFCFYPYLKRIKVLDIQTCQRRRIAPLPPAGGTPINFG